MGLDSWFKLNWVDRRHFGLGLQTSHALHLQYSHDFSLHHGWHASYEMSFAPAFGVHATCGAAGAAAVAGAAVVAGFCLPSTAAFFAFGGGGGGAAGSGGGAHAYVRPSATPAVFQCSARRAHWQYGGFLQKPWLRSGYRSA